MNIHELFGYVLSTNPPIVENVLKHMSFKSLGTCACVCKLWNSIARTIKRKRRSIFHTMSVSHRADRVGETAMQASGSKNTFFNVGQTFCNNLDNNFNDSKFGLIFCSESICSKPQIYFYDLRNQKPKEKTFIVRSHSWDTAFRSTLYGHGVMDFLATHIQKSCDVIFCCSEGIIGTPKNEKPLECNNKDNPAICGTFFPDYKGVSFWFFPIEEKICCINSSFILDSLENAIHKPIKCLLVFTLCNPRPSGYVTSTINIILLKQSGQVAIGGGIMGDLCYPSKRNRMSSNVGLVISGDNVSASSLVLDSKIKTPEQVEEKLKLFKHSIVPQCEHCAYMFTCFERRTFYNQPNMEANIFAKLYPGIPLFGALSYGEIGVDYLPNRPKSKKRWVDKWLHNFTTVFVLLSFKVC